MSKIDNPEVARVFDGYPEPMRKKMMRLRQLVLDTASETEGVDAPEETLKWGEPSYLTKDGSTIRMDWKARVPDQYAIVLQLQHVVGCHIQSGLRRCVHIRGQQSHRVRRNRRVPGRRTETLHLARSDISSRETSTVARRLTETLSDAFTGNISWTRLTSKRR